MNAEDVNANTALMCAIDDGHLRVVRELLKHTSVALNATNTVGRTALTYVVVVNAKDLDGWAPLHSDRRVRRIT